MSDVRSILERGVTGVGPPRGGYERMLRRRDRRSRNRRIRASVLGIVIAFVVGYAASSAIRSAPTPATSPSPTRTSPGLFAQVHGWIAYSNDRGTDGIWAVNPETPGDPKDQILLSPGTGWPVAWSSDGSKLLISRPNTERPPTQAFFGRNLFVLNADGTETRLTNGDAWIDWGSFSPDGSEVVYASGIGSEPSRIIEVDTAGGSPHVLLTATTEELFTPTFSPDGSTISYFVFEGGSFSLRVMDADGTSSRVLGHVALADQGGRPRLAWSPDGTRLAIDYRGIYTVRADGSDLTLVIHGRDPNWSPDGSHIAYNDRILTGGDLVIADADGRDAQEFGDARAGPWNPLG